MVIDFSRAWRYRGKRQAARHRKFLKRQAARLNRRAAKRDPECGIVWKLSSSDVI